MQSNWKTCNGMEKSRVMPNLNYRKGSSFERRFINDLLKDRIVLKYKTPLHAIESGRFPASKGICDVWWINEFGKFNEAQLKYSSKGKPSISPGELANLKKFAKEMDGKIVVWLVKKQYRKPISVELIT